MGSTPPHEMPAQIRSDKSLRKDCRNTKRVLQRTVTSLRTSARMTERMLAGDGGGNGGNSGGSASALCSSPTETLAGEDAGDSDALPTLSTSTDSFSCAAELALRLASPARRLTVILEQQRSITESKTGI